MLEMELPGKIQGRPQRRWMDVVKEDMEMICVTLEEATERVEWWFTVATPGGSSWGRKEGEVNEDEEGEAVVVEVVVVVLEGKEQEE